MQWNGLVVARNAGIEVGGRGFLESGIWALDQCIFAIPLKRSSISINTSIDYSPRLPNLRNIISTYVPP